MSTDTENEDKKPILPAKSSMEILSELFSTFHAEPPLIIKKEKTEDSSSKKHKKKKKHKHKEKKHKKKSKKKRKSSSVSSFSISDDDSKVDLAKILIKQEKDLRAKKIKIEGTELAYDISDSRKESKAEGKRKIKDIKKEKESDKQIRDISPKTPPRKSENKSKIVIKDLKNSSVFDSLKQSEGKAEGEITDSDSIPDKKKKKHKHKSSSKKRSRSKSHDRKSKKLKTEDLRNKLSENSSKEHKSKHHHSKEKDRDFYKDHKSKEESSSHNKDRSKDKYRRSRSRERSDKYKDEYSRDLEEYKRARRAENPFYKDDGLHKFRERDRERDRSKERDDKWSGRDRYRVYGEKDDRYRRNSRERDKDNSSRFDKKKLLEIARKNAIAMMKSGSLPAALTLGPQAQEKVIAAIKSGGKTIEELTDFCKTLSKKEELGELSSLSEKDDSDSDNDKPFHHPFQIKDRPTSITMNIKNSVPLPIKSSLERTAELRMQFPVSSGQQHRKEEEWVPVSPPTQKKEEKPLPISIAPSSIPLPIEAPPAHVATPVAVPVTTSSEIMTVPAPPNAPPGPQVFPTPVLMPAVDIGSIVSQRLSAMRRLQENPNDVQALTQMYKSNKEMQNWAVSKQQPGQFTGSTGAQILSQSELAAGYQAWAKKDQLQTAAPVSGGMGMHLLQKMGWKPGEGLGKEKTGTLEPLLLEVKLDKKGLVANEEQQRGKKQKLKGVGNMKNLQGKHPVSLLGEYASKKKLGAPQYILEFECGPDHKKNFLFKVVLNGVEYKPNIASNNKKEAKAAAASICLQQIGLLQPPPPTQLPTVQP